MFINQKGNEIKSLDNVVLEDHDIWVIGSTEKGSYEHALVVYVGEKLDKSVALDVTAKDGSVVYNAETSQPFWVSMMTLPMVMVITLAWTGHLSVTV